MIAGHIQPVRVRLRAWRRSRWPRLARRQAPSHARATRAKSASSPSGPAAAASVHDRLVRLCRRQAALPRAGAAPACSRRPCRARAGCDRSADVELSRRIPHPRRARRHDETERVDVARAVGFGFRFAEARHRREKLRVEPVRRLAARRQRDGRSVFVFGGAPVPFERAPDFRQREMRVGNSRVDLDRPKRRRLRLLEAVRGPAASNGSRAKCARAPSPSARRRNPDRARAPARSTKSPTRTPSRLPRFQ